ncbi:hypothetical protein LCGC14_0659930 [marine sediment metagenome]|uniref:Uncharacterized protein n=1 Tax=marine sediment metagenome TaxID=412755 RepID=A0A0F9QZ43_9ZZZZ
MAGRPKRVFTEEEVSEIEEMAQRNCNTNTIARKLDIPFNSLERHFGKQIRQGRAIWKDKVRIAQDNLKETPQMAIWLGKQDLGQVDKQVIATETVNAKPQTAKDLQAAKAAAKAYNEAMAKADVKPRIVPITGTRGS